MVYQVLARKWRPRTFQDVVGQEPIVRSLVNALVGKKIGHAYLLAGTRGIGKTTVARIFARAVRCLDLSSDANACGRCNACSEGAGDLNIIEIDGASNNTVDEVRELVDHVRYLPTSGGFKVYIIDEVHMLSKSAFNALLKTLEEPPSHVVFIFATTAPEKLPGTVLSRCQRFDFRNAPLDVLIRHIEHIGQREGIAFDDEKSIAEICRIGDGSIRDTLSALDRVLSYTADNKVTEEVLQYALGIVKGSSVRRIIEGIFTGDVQTVVVLYRGMVGENIPVENIVRSILDRLFDIIESGDAQLSEEELFWIYEELVRDFGWALDSIDPCKVVEIILRKVAKRKDLLVGQGSDVVPKKGWVSFLDFVGEESAAMRMNLEKGNLLGEPTLSSKGLELELAFPSEARLFLEYLEDVRSDVIGYLARFYNVENGAVALKMGLIGNEEADRRNFKSRDKIIEEENKRIALQKKKNILSDPLIKKTEELFNAKIDNIIVKDS